MTDYNKNMFTRTMVIVLVALTIFFTIILLAEFYSHGGLFFIPLIPIAMSGYGCYKFINKY